MDEAISCLKEWQKILRLQDWEIVLKISRHDDMGLDEVCGSSNWVLARGEAILKLLDPIDYSSDIVFPQDQEVTLVHELLHLHYAPFSENFERGSLEHIALEKSIEVTAKALVALKRGDAQ